MQQLDPHTALVIFSGGQDSTTCLWAALEAYPRVHAITFNYGQRHQAELDAAENIITIARHQFGDRMGQHEVLDLGQGILHSTSPLVSSAVLEQYESPDHLPGGLEKTFVPMRNQMFLTLAVNRALALRAGVVITGVCQEDFGGYPDCRQVFIEQFARASAEALGAVKEDGQIDQELCPRIYTPLMNLSKAASVRWALDIEGCYGALAYSHTAYDGQYPPYGADHATLLREKGFRDAGVTDPIWVRAGMEGFDIPDAYNHGLTEAQEEQVLRAAQALSGY